MPITFFLIISLVVFLALIGLGVSVWFEYVEDRDEAARGNFDLHEEARK